VGKNMDGSQEWGLGDGKPKKETSAPLTLRIGSTPSRKTSKKVRIKLKKEKKRERKKNLQSMESQTAKVYCGSRG